MILSVSVMLIRIPPRNMSSEHEQQNKNQADKNCNTHSHGLLLKNPTRRMFNKIQQDTTRCA